MRKYSYLDLKFKPNLDKYLIATFRIESKLGLSKAAEHIAAESSIGTWTPIEGLSDAIFNKLSPKIFYLNPKKKIAKVAYPIDLFEKGSIPQLLSSLGGNIFSMKVIDNLRWEDIEFPKSYINSFQGPALGIDGIRGLLKIKDRPIVGSIIKPKVGLPSAKQAEISYRIWTNGVDVVKDDENLTSMTFNNFKDRVKLVLAALKAAEKQTGEKKVYICNVTAPIDEMIERAKLIKKSGGTCAMVDLVSVGLGAVQTLRKQNLGLIIHGHRAGHSTFTRNPAHGISMYVIAKLSRLAGIDQLHTGTVVGKMEGSKEEVAAINEFLREDWNHHDNSRENWCRIKPIMPIASGGLHPALIEKLIKNLGKNIIVNFGGGLHGHPDGAAAGARGCRQAVEAANLGIAAETYAKSHPELARALVYWAKK